MDMNNQQQALPQNARRRPSKLSERLANEKLERARRMTPEERLALALDLSDFCRELSRVGERALASPGRSDFQNNGSMMVVSKSIRLRDEF